MDAQFPLAGRGGDINRQSSNYPDVISAWLNPQGSQAGSLSLHLELEALDKDFSNFGPRQLPISGLHGTRMTQKPQWRGVWKTRVGAHLGEKSVSLCERSYFKGQMGI